MAEPDLEREHPADDGKVAREVGQLLREARLVRGKKDLARIAQYLWVPPEHLEALEHGDLPQTAGRFDPAVLVQRYADHLGLDGRWLAERLGTPSPQAQAAVLPQHRKFAYTPGVRLVAVAGAALFLTAVPADGNRTPLQPLQSAMDPLEPSPPPHNLGRSMAPEPTFGFAAQDELMLRGGSPDRALLTSAELFFGGAILPAGQGERLQAFGAHRLLVQPSSSEPVLQAGVLLAAAPAQEDVGELYREATELYRAGKYVQALPLFERALELAETRYGSNSPRLALDLNNLGEIYRLLGQHEAAEPLFQRAIDLAGRPGTNGRGLGSSLNNLALLYREQGRLAEATRLQERAVAAFEAELGPDHPRVATSVNNLAALYQEQTLAIAELVLDLSDLTTEASRSASGVAEARPSGEPDADAPFPIPKPPSPEGLALVDLPPNSRAEPPVESAGVAHPVARGGEVLAIGRPVPPPLAPVIEPAIGAPIGIGTANVSAVTEPGGATRPAEAHRESDADERHPDSPKGDPEVDVPLPDTWPTEQQQAVAVPAPPPVAVTTSQGNHTGRAHASEAAGEQTEPPAPIRLDDAATPSPSAERSPRAGQFSVLVSSMRDPADVADEWRLLQQNYPALANLELWPPRPEATESEVVYRLVAGSLASVAEAEGVCETLRWDGQHCSVVPFPGGREDRGRAEAPVRRVAPAGGFTIQVALVRDPAEVPQEWRRLAKRHPGLAELELRPSRPVEVAEKGIFHRVTGGSFTTRGEAQAACERLREEGGECVVIAP